jgi:hypothetical protein
MTIAQEDPLPGVFFAFTKESNPARLSKMTFSFRINTGEYIT